MKTFIRIILIAFTVATLMCAVSCQSNKCVTEISNLEAHLSVELGQEVEVTPSEEFCECIQKAKIEEDEGCCYDQYVHTLVIQPKPKPLYTELR